MRTEPVQDLPPLAAQAAAQNDATTGAQAPTTTTAPAVEERSTAFRAVQGGEVKSGEVLLVEAYAAIWAVVFVLILLAFRRQRRIDGRVDALEAAIERVRRAEERGKGEG